MQEGAARFLTQLHVGLFAELASFENSTAVLQGTERDGVRFAPPFEIFDLLVSNVLLNFLVGVATGVATDRVLEKIRRKKKAGKEPLAKDESMELMSELLGELRAQPTLTKQLSNFDVIGVRGEIRELLLKHGWSTNDAEAAALKAVAYLAKQLSKALESRKEIGNP